MKFKVYRNDALIAEIEAVERKPGEFAYAKGVERWDILERVSDGARFVVIHNNDNPRALRDGMQLQLIK